MENDTPTVEITTPWRAVPVQDGDRHWVAIIDPARKEICRIPLNPEDTESVVEVNAFSKIIMAVPWLMMAAIRTLRDFDRLEGIKDGTTVRQWIRNHEGYRRRAELRDACERAWEGSTKPPPPSYGVVS